MLSFQDNEGSFDSQKLEPQNLSFFLRILKSVCVFVCKCLEVRGDFWQPLEELGHSQIGGLLLPASVSKP